jgi:hypothetical protein
MSGVKGRSGRRARYHELNVNQLAKLSEKSIRDCLKDLTVPLQTRAQLGMAFLNKYMPDKIDQRIVNLTVSEDLISRILNYIESNNPIEYDDSSIISVQAAQNNSDDKDIIVPNPNANNNLQHP